MTTSSPGNALPNSLTQLHERLHVLGYDLVSLTLIGQELYLEGSAPSFDAKRTIEVEARQQTGFWITNCLRIAPGSSYSPPQERFAPTHKHI